jgi:mevalonate pyrophosphate decarboxylase
MEGVTVSRMSRATAASAARLVSSGLGMEDVTVSRIIRATAASAARLVSSGLGMEDVTVSRMSRANHGNRFAREGTATESSGLKR